MTFQQLTYVVEISKCGSINKAAHKLFLSQSGISTAVRELEEELGIKFFVRSNRGVEFTPEGKEFLGYAVSLLEQKQRIESLYGESRSTIAPVHFSVSTQRYPFTEDAFLEMLQQNQENRYQYTLKETSMDGVIDDVYDHRADIGVIYLTKLTEKIVCRLLDARELTFYELAAVPPCVYVRKGHPLTQLEHVSEADLEGYPYSSFEQAQGVAVDFSEELPMVSMRKPSKAIIVNNPRHERSGQYGRLQHWQRPSCRASLPCQCGHHPSDGQGSGAAGLDLSAERQALLSRRRICPPSGTVYSAFHCIYLFPASSDRRQISTYK